MTGIVYSRNGLRYSGAMESAARKKAASHADTEMKRQALEKANTATSQSPTAGTALARPRGHHPAPLRAQGVTSDYPDNRQSGENVIPGRRPVRQPREQVSG